MPDDVPIEVANAFTCKGFQPISMEDGTRTWFSLADREGEFNAHCCQSRFGEYEIDGKFCHLSRLRSLFYSHILAIDFTYWLSN